MLKYRKATLRGGFFVGWLCLRLALQASPLHHGHGGGGANPPVLPIRPWACLQVVHLSPLFTGQAGASLRGLAPGFCVAHPSAGGMDHHSLNSGSLSSLRLLIEANPPAVVAAFLWSLPV